ncbi:ATP-binding protein [Streptomyces sp. NPDC101132]|uniref:ATP-binding protein n=1 Tax=Streptomyces sp. NPDC101132 TaxID=3366110 RepID=UPI0037F1CE5D
MNPTSREDGAGGAGGAGEAGRRPGEGARAPADHRLRRLELAGSARPCARARAFTRRALADWAWSGGSAHAAEDAVLVVAELVANATAHGGGPLDVTLDARGPRLRMEVGDRAPELPVPRRPHRQDLPGGHGLFIVERAAARWGVLRRGSGKVVWAELDAVPASPRPGGA